MFNVLLCDIIYIYRNNIAPQRKLSKLSGIVEVIRDENKEIKQRRIHPANPLYPKMSIGMLKNEHRYAQKCGRENTDEKKDLKTTTTKSPPVVVVDDDK